MSTLKVTNIQATGETASRAVSGVAAAWLNYKGTSTNAINDSVNVASVTDNGSGDYSVNFSNNMGNSTYMIHGTGEQLSTFNVIDVCRNYSNAYTASVARIVGVQQTAATASTRSDVVTVNFSAHGDLA